LFDPNEFPEQCASYMSRFLGCPVSFIRAEVLPQSTRLAPWRLDVQFNGIKRAYVLQLDTRGMEHELVPTPRAFGLDMQGEALGVPCFFSEFIEGESLLGPMQAGETWAENLYLDTVCTLQSVTDDDLGKIAQELERITVENMLEKAYTSLKGRSLSLADAVYQKLKTEMPALPPVRFSNGDLWLDNFIVKDRKLAGVIDFQDAVFSDPIFEFLLSFFVSPELQGRGIEERFCQRIEVNPAVLHWYRGLEYFDVWPWLLKTGKTFVHHTLESVELNLKKWLEKDD
jgi:aminoglycoside phosphotransferase (APT) family kinase protein